jgi:hypothetical protein
MSTIFLVPETPLLQARVRAHGLQRLSPEDVATRLPLLHTGGSVTKLFFASSVNLLKKLCPWQF